MIAFAKTWAQDTTFALPSKTIEKIPDCIDIEVDEEGNIFVLSQSKSQLHKYFKMNNYDSVLIIGGFGIEGEAFSLPSKIDARNRQTFFLLDAGNRRLLVLNTNLKPTQEINFSVLESKTIDNAQIPAGIYPKTFAVSASGELFILNEDDNQIHKLNIFGKYETAFGGTNYGEGSLFDAVQMQCDNQQLFVYDNEDQHIKVYDFFGFFQFSIDLKGKIEAENFIASGKNLFIFNANEILIYNFETTQTQKITFANKLEIVDIELGKDFLYVLNKKAVNLYPLNKK